MERLTILDDARNVIGEMRRDEVHQKGIWHDTFQCLIYDNDFVYFQLRSKEKQDFPDLLDISVGGHIQAGETLKDGMREITEELGIIPNPDDVKFREVIQTVIEIDGPDPFIDKEFAHVHTLEIDDVDLEQIHFADGEVADLIQFEKFQAKQLFNLQVDDIAGISVASGDKEHYAMEDFVPHDASYYEKLAQLF